MVVVEWWSRGRGLWWWWSGGVGEGSRAALYTLFASKPSVHNLNMCLVWEMRAEAMGWHSTQLWAI